MVSIDVNSIYLTKDGSLVKIYNVIPVKGKLIYPMPTEAFHNFIRYEGKCGKRFKNTESGLDLIKEIDQKEYPEYFI